ncbi:hypothetical protein [Sphingomonas sp. H160509]|uniref:hypothetical protein n=1 Tax=Sphingomonas sp. H160509 TaxID=2955313 RepID=UPI0031585EDF
MRGCLVVAALAVAAPAQAGQGAVDLPAGRLGDAVLALGRQSGTSIVVGDPALWARRVPAVRGRMSAREALDRLATAANADVVAAGAFGWRLTARTPRVVRVKRPKVVPVAAPPAVQGADIVVTGSKRDVRLRDFAGQVALLDGVDLALGGAGGTEAIPRAAGERIVDASRCRPQQAVHSRHRRFQLHRTDPDHRRPVFR